MVGKELMHTLASIIWIMHTFKDQRLSRVSELHYVSSLDTSLQCVTGL